MYLNIYVFIFKNAAPVYCYIAERAFLHQLKVVHYNIINLKIANVKRILRLKQTNVII